MSFSWFSSLFIFITFRKAIRAAHQGITPQPTFEDPKIWLSD